jgi:hypothetical protein
MAVSKKSVAFASDLRNLARPEGSGRARTTNTTGPEAPTKTPEGTSITSCPYQHRKTLAGSLDVRCPFGQTYLRLRYMPAVRMNTRARSAGNLARPEGAGRATERRRRRFYLPNKADGSPLAGSAAAPNSGRP